MMEKQQKESLKRLLSNILKIIKRVSFTAKVKDTLILLEYSFYFDR